jgi:hypothetical protein
VYGFGGLVTANLPVFDEYLVGGTGPDAFRDCENCAHDNKGKNDDQNQ